MSPSVISQHGLLETGDYHTVTECLCQCYAPEGNKVEWQYKLQTRVQKPGEQLEDFAGALRVLANKAYPTWSAQQRQEILRSICPGDLLLIGSALVDAGDAQSHGQSAAHCHCK